MRSERSRRANPRAGGARPEPHSPPRLTRTRDCPPARPPPSFLSLNNKIIPSRLRCGRRPAKRCFKRRRLTIRQREDLTRRGGLTGGFLPWAGAPGPRLPRMERGWAGVSEAATTGGEAPGEAGCQERGSAPVLAPSSECICWLAEGPSGARSCGGFAVLLHLPDKSLSLSGLLLTARRRRRRTRFDPQDGLQTVTSGGSWPTAAGLIGHVEVGGGMRSPRRRETSQRPHSSSGHGPGAPQSGGEWPLPRSRDARQLTSGGDFAGLPGLGALRTEGIGPVAAAAGPAEVGEGRRPRRVGPPPPRGRASSLQPAQTTSSPHLPSPQWLPACLWAQEPRCSCRCVGRCADWTRRRSRFDA